ncbi:hypothetical protein NIES2107_57280 [Nostoc carneum NIES-2107]|nr:hypothetical protein NIES2107_57280 [Nostoc carneum NIES-2107]
MLLATVQLNIKLQSVSRVCYGYESIWDKETMKFSRHAPLHGWCVRRYDSNCVANHIENQSLTHPTVILFLLYK